MPWAAGNYTKGNNATGGWAGDSALGIGIEAGRHDTQDNDFASGIDACINKAGQNTPTANLPMGGFKHTNVANASANTEYAAWGQLRNGTPVFIDTLNSRLGVGTTSPSTTLEINSTSVAPFLSSHAGAGTAIAARRFTNDSNGCWLNLHKSRGTTIDSQVTVQNNDQLGVVYFSGSNGTSFEAAASITVSVDGVPSTNIPARFQITLQNGTTTITPVTVLSSGFVGIGTSTPSHQLRLSTDSAAKPTTNTWTIASDERIKTNIAPYTKGLNELMQVEPITYDYNGKGGFLAGPGGVSILAQQLQPVFPECISTFTGKLNEDDVSDTELLAYDGHAITFALINAVKELGARVEALEAQIAGA